jgi:hypothetical protein
MLHFDAAPVVTSNPFSVNGKHFLSRNREMLGDRPTGAARHRPCARALDAGVDRQAKRRAAASEQNVRLAAPCDRASRYHDRERGPPARETHHAKVDHDPSVAGPDRHFGGDSADGWFAKYGWFAKSSRTSIDELGPAIAAGSRTGRPPPAARRSSALGEKPDGSERSSQPGERGARPHDQRHLPRLLNTGPSPLPPQRSNDVGADKSGPIGFRACRCSRQRKGWFG